MGKCLCVYMKSTFSLAFKAIKIISSFMRYSMIYSEDGKMSMCLYEKHFFSCI